jgi:hypothetical protein
MNLQKVLETDVSSNSNTRAEGDPAGGQLFQAFLITLLRECHTKHFQVALERDRRADIILWDQTHILACHSIPPDQLEAADD